jgi:DNA polymerase-4
VSRSQVRRPRGPLDLGDDDTGCTILHVDMDAFYASVELLERPELRGTPVIVGASTGNRGVVLSATYEARELGVHSAMPVSRARRLAPQATFISPHHDRYAEASRAVMDIFGSITPIVEPLSLDEAFLDVSGALRRLGRPAAIAALIRSRVEQEVGITCSVGVAANKFVAKLASTHSKPDGLLVIPKDAVIDFLHPLPVGALWGVGEKTEEQLVRLGLETVGDIAAMPVATLERALGRAQGMHLHDLSWGRDPRAVVPDEPEKSVGNEETFDSDTDDHEWIRSRVAGLSDQVARRLRASESVARTVGLKVRFADFTTITRSRTLEVPTDVGADIYSTAWSLFTALGLQRARIRLVGVRVEGLSAAESTPTQLLLDAPERGHRDAEVAMDRLRKRYGPGAIRPGRVQ